MSKRPRVPVPEVEMQDIQQMAKNAGLAVGEYVRSALRQVAAGRPKKSSPEKLAAIRAAAACHFPTGGVEEMNREIEMGYSS